MYTTTVSGSGANSSPFHDAAILPSDHGCQLRRSVFEIACGVGLPIKLTLEFGIINPSFGLFARVLVDFDLVILSPYLIEWDNDDLTTVPINPHLGRQRNHKINFLPTPLKKGQMINFVSKRKEVLCGKRKINKMKFEKEGLWYRALKYANTPTKGALMYVVGFGFVASNLASSYSSSPPAKLRLLRDQIQNEIAKLGPNEDRLSHESLAQVVVASLLGITRLIMASNAHIALSFAVVTVWKPPLFAMWREAIVVVRHDLRVGSWGLF
ncbi:hypothetical protein D8674_033318 [Pyrus ussuriensis x Pyrus communis]|uniref:Uncharacterized protein n=1 Tax=Pyrus ussuriensis x Pyrus communis TaxID=2448454 RepID=A0A5N5HPF9_9ROSA|nr:hypothetical protein D8674_033318 [Pyrus ussuriensis x Pyrus communis]